MMIRSLRSFLVCFFAFSIATVLLPQPLFSISSFAAAPPFAAGPCSLLTQPEVETALGKGATMNSTKNPRTGMDECRLKPAQAGKVQEIIVVVLSAQGWDTVKKTFVDGKDIKEVRGIGEDGFVGRFIGYNVKKGQKYVKVFGPLTNDAAANDKATRFLAERAVSRL